MVTVTFAPSFSRLPALALLRLMRAREEARPARVRILGRPSG
jgi:hypothetical protein